MSVAEQTKPPTVASRRERKAATADAGPESQPGRRPMVWIAVCTRDREAQLRTAMASLAELDPPDHFDMGLLIVENAPEASLPEKLKDVQMPFPVAFALEPEPGFSSVRNRAASEAVRLGAEWIAWFDDDQTAHRGWLKRLMAVTELYPQDRMFTGRQRLLYRDTRELAQRRSVWDNPVTGSDGRRGGTCNALLHRSIFAEDGLGWRFDPDFNLTGGEDTELFNRYHRHCGQVVWVEDAVVFEEVVPDRDSEDFRLVREASVHWTVGHIAVKHLGQKEGRIECFRMLVKAGYRAVRDLFIGIITAPIRPSVSTARIRNARFAIARMRGYFAAMTGRKVSRYPALKKAAAQG